MTKDSEMAISEYKKVIELNKNPKQTSKAIYKIGCTLRKCSVQMLLCDADIHSLWVFEF